MTVVSPIHIEALGLSNVRFFAPLTGKREFPWVSIDDLFASVVMDRRMRRMFHADIRNSVWASSTRVVETSAGPLRIAQHYVAQGLIDAWTELGRCSPDFYGRYTAGGVKALSKLTDGLGRDEFTSYVRDAMQTGGGAS